MCFAPNHTGNVHINIVANKYAEEIENAIEPYVYEVVCECILTCRRCSRVNVVQRRRVDPSPLSMASVSAASLSTALRWLTI